MGNFCCCFSFGGEDEPSPEEQRDMAEARVRAAQAAEARQKQFEDSPQGRAAKRAVEMAQKEKQNAGKTTEPTMRWQVG